MPVAIKVSDILAEEARTAAEDADRSLTGQVEHWARIGKAVEPHFSTQAIAFLKKGGRFLTSGEEKVAIQRTLEALEQLVSHPPYEETRQLIFRDGPVYEANPDDPGSVVQVHQDGSRIVGQIVDRQFVPTTAS